MIPMMPIALRIRDRNLSLVTASLSFVVPGPQFRVRAHSSVRRSLSAVRCCVREIRGSTTYEYRTEEPRTPNDEPNAIPNQEPAIRTRNDENLFI